VQKVGHLLPQRGIIERGDVSPTPLAYLMGYKSSWNSRESILMGAPQQVGEV